VLFRRKKPGDRCSPHVDHIDKILFGDAHIHGMEGVRFNTRLKSVTTRWPDDVTGADSGIAMHFPSGDSR